MHEQYVYGEMSKALNNIGTTLSRDGFVFVKQGKDREICPELRT